MNTRALPLLGALALLPACCRARPTVAGAAGAPRVTTALALLLSSLVLVAQSKVVPTNAVSGSDSAPAPAPPAPTVAKTESTSTAVAASKPQPLDESAFRLIGERNIFNANRSGGRVQLPSSRPRRIETFALVGTMAYEKGAFAFFDGSSSEFSKVLRANDVIAGHKLVDVLAEGVKLEADGKQFELRVGTGMRREDAGAWQVAEVAGGDGGGGRSYAESRNDEAGGRSSRSGRGGDSGRSRREESRDTGNRPAAPAPAAPAISDAEKNDVLKRLMERREKE